METKGCPHYCWCMLWRKPLPLEGRKPKENKKASLKQYVEDEIPVGFLAYHENTAIAWCSVAPRESYKKLGGDENLNNVWSATCFFIKRDYRKKGLFTQLVNAAINYARENEAKYLEAYTVEPESTTYRYMGLVPLFETLGFKYVKDAGTKRKVMVKEIM